MKPLALICVSTVVCAISFAQYQTNNQIYGSPAPSVKYGWGPGYQIAPTAEMMPSEFRNAAFMSGALPSDIRMGYQALGPNLPLQAYVPAPGPRYQVGQPGPVGNYVPSGAAPQSLSSVGKLQPLPPTATLPAIPGAASIRYGSAPSAAMSSAMPVASARSSLAAAPSAAPMPAGYRLSGSVRYGG